MANLIINNPYILNAEDIEHWALIDLREFTVAREFIRSKMSQSDYEELQASHNFDIHPLKLSDSKNIIVGE